MVVVKDVDCFELEKFFGCICWCGVSCCLWFGGVEKVFEMLMLVWCVLLFVVCGVRFTVMGFLLNVHSNGIACRTR